MWSDIWHTINTFVSLRETDKGIDSVQLYLYMAPNHNNSYLKVLYVVR